VSNATCTPLQIGDLDGDPCLMKPYPEETVLDQPGVCPRDLRQLVVRAMNESLARLTFDIDLNYVLTFDDERKMWVLEYKSTGVKTW
ncbi:hypothetical protein PMAYCL1PPCAC_08947, partial [Pristionchus mayeri]